MTMLTAVTAATLDLDEAVVSRVINTYYYALLLQVSFQGPANTALGTIAMRSGNLVIEQQNPTLSRLMAAPPSRDELVQSLVRLIAERHA